MPQDPIGYNPAATPGASISGEISGVRLAADGGGGGIWTTNTDPNISGIDPITGLYAPPGTDIGAGAFARSAWIRGVQNGDFANPPQNPDIPINSDVSSESYNPLPGWLLVDGSNGADQWWWEPSDAAGSGGQIRIDTTPSSGDSYLLARIPVRSSQSQNVAVLPVLSWYADVDPSTLLEIVVQFMQDDGVTQIGPTIGVTTDRFAAHPIDLVGQPLVVPADCGWVLLSIGLFADGPGSYTATLRFTEVTCQIALPVLLLPDLADPTKAPGATMALNGRVYILPTWVGGQSISPGVAVDPALGLIGPVSPTTLILPTSTTPAQTAEGSVVWDSDDDVLTIGTGAARKTLVNQLGGQIAFPATQNPSSDPNTLDDYEEGTWTPGLSFGGGTTGMTYGTCGGYYTKIGRVVPCTGLLNLTAKGSSTGAAALTGLPFAVANNEGARGGGNTSYYANLAAGVVGLLFVPASNRTTAPCYLPGVSATATAATDAHFTNATNIYFSFSYNV